VSPLTSKSIFSQWIKRVWTILRIAFNKFLRIEGVQWAGAFSFNMFFSLFPLIVLLVTIVSTFIDGERAGKQIINYIESYVPISGEMHNYIFSTITDVINAREQAGLIAFVILVWAALQCFITLIGAVNHAWGTGVSISWWRLPLRSLVLLGTTISMILLGIVMPVMLRITKNWLVGPNDSISWLYDIGSFFITFLISFLCLSILYKLAPFRSTKFAEVWAAALFSTFLLLASESLFAIYLRYFSRLTVVFGTFGGIMALLLWIYLCGCIFILGACLCAAQAEASSQLMKKGVVLNNKRIE
jgi:YihY family inner membrane protein